MRGGVFDGDEVAYSNCGLQRIDAISDAALRHFSEAYGEKAYKKLAQLADAVGIGGKDDAEKAKAFIQAIKDLNASMDIPTKIEGKWTIKEEDIPTMVERALSEANPLYPVPVIWGKEEMTAMYHKIM